MSSSSRYTFDRSVTPFGDTCAKEWQVWADINYFSSEKPSFRGGLFIFQAKVGIQSLKGQGTNSYSLVQLHLINFDYFLHNKLPWQRVLKTLYMNVQSSVIHYNLKVETAQCPSSWMSFDRCLHPCNDNPSWNIERFNSPQKITSAPLQLMFLYLVRLFFSSILGPGDARDAE